MRNKLLMISAILIFSLPSFAYQKSDSLKIINLTTRVEKVEGFREVKDKELDLKFKELSTDLTSIIKKDSQLITFIGVVLGIFGIGTIITFFGLWWKGKKYIEKKLKEKFDNIITEKEGDILALIDKQSKEKQFVKNKKILVLTAKNGDDSFLRTFFKAMGFPINNVRFVKVDEYQLIPDYYPDLVFANNEKGDLSSSGEGDKLKFDLIDEYFEKSSPETVLFYFNATRHNYINPKVKDRLSFANARTQIYGNLINLFKYQNILKK